VPQTFAAAVAVVVVAVVDCHVAATSAAILVQLKVTLLPPMKIATAIDRFPCVVGPRLQQRPQQLRLPAIGPLTWAAETWGR